MPKRRTHGSGSVDEVTPGRWRVRVRNAEGVQRTLGRYDSEAEARAILAATLAELVAKERAPVGALTLASWGDTWHKQRLADGVRGAEKEKAVWDLRVARSDLGKMPVREITRAHVLKWFEAVRAAKVLRPARGGGTVATDKTIAKQTASHALHVLRSALHAARDAGHIRVDPTDGVKPPRSKGTTTAEEPWTWMRPAEIAALERCTTIPALERAIYLVALYSGLRRGELWALRWGDIDLDGKAPEITVSRSHKGPPKNGKIRRVPLLPGAAAALRTIRPKDPPADRLVFPTAEGKQRGRDDDARWAPQTRRSVLKDGTVKHYRVNGYREKAGISRRVRFHDLRHTCASHLVMGTWGPQLSLHEVMLWMGHSSITQTERYAHLCPDRLAARVAGSAGGSGGGLNVSSPVESAAPAPVAKPLDLQRARRESNPQPSDPKSAVMMNDSAQVDAARTQTGLIEALAVAVLRAAARGVYRPADGVALAREAVALGVPGAGPAALRVLDGGPTAASAAVDVAEAVLDAVAVTRGAERASG